MSLSGPVLIVEPYLGGSHKAWAEGLQRNLGVPVDILGLPARWWKWRMRGAAVTLARQCADLGRSPDVVLASDMLDLAAFRTFSRPFLGDVPVALYFHESQLTYPDSPQMEPDLSYAFTNWTSALAADRVLFNSEYHRSVFLQEFPRLLRHFPDHTHEHLVEEVVDRSEVVEVGVDLSWVSEAGRRSGPVRILWNHRWEYDKAPDEFFSAIDRLASEGLDFELAVCGENFRQEPAEFELAARHHADRLVHMGNLSRSDYLRLLLDCDVVVSTARQEFFGVAVVEAVAAACFPLLPDRLSYPHVVPPEWHRMCLYPDGGLTDRLRWAITHPGEVRRAGAKLAPEMQRFGWDEMAPRYFDALSRTVTTGRG